MCDPRKQNAIVPTQIFTDIIITYRAYFRATWIFFRPVVTAMPLNVSDLIKTKLILVNSSQNYK